MIFLLKIFTLIFFCSCWGTEKSLINELQDFEKDHVAGLQSPCFDTFLKEKYPSYFKTGKKATQEARASCHLAYDTAMEAIYENRQKFESYDHAAAWLKHVVQLHTYLNSFNPKAIHKQGLNAIDLFQRLKWFEFNPPTDQK